MGIPIPGKGGLYIETGSCTKPWIRSFSCWCAVKHVRSCNGLIFNMGIPIPGKGGLYIETGSCTKPWIWSVSCECAVKHVQACEQGVNKPAMVLISLEIPGSTNYRQISNIRHTKSKHLNVSRLTLQLSLPHAFKPGVKSRMKMWLEQRRQVMLQLHLSDQQFHRHIGVTYIRSLTVHIYYYSCFQLAQWGRNKMAAIWQMTFSNDRKYLYFVSEVCCQGPINSKPALVQIMGWCQTGVNRLSEPELV